MSAAAATAMRLLASAEQRAGKLADEVARTTASVTLLVAGEGVQSETLA